MKKNLKILPLVLLLSALNITAQTSPLPVELVYFNFQLDGKNVQLFWGTATETNNAYFEVQRYSESSWESIHFEPGAGTSNSPKYYAYVDTETVMGGYYLYRLLQVDNSGGSEFSDTLFVSITTGVDEYANEVIPGFYLSQNFPNPFNPTTIISYVIPNVETLHPAGAGQVATSLRHVSLKVYDMLGRQIATLVNEEKAAGNYKVEFNGSNLTSGIYFYVLSAGNRSLTKKMCLLK